MGSARAELQCAQSWGPSSGGQIGRLNPGVSKEQAQAEMSNLARRLAKAFPSTNQGWHVHVVPLQEEIK